MATNWPFFIETKSNFITTPLNFISFSLLGCNMPTFERIQKHQHFVNGQPLAAYYDRITTKFSLEYQGKLVLSKYLLFWPSHKAKVQINAGTYTLKITWLLVWNAYLKANKKVVVKELLPQRRRRSVILLGYFIVITSIRALFVLFDY